MNLKEYIEKMGFSYRKFGLLANVNPAIISKVCQGKKCNKKIAKKIIRATKNEVNFENIENLKKPMKAKGRGWREIDDKRIFFRSSWEINYAYFLSHQKLLGEIADWEFEPESFIINIYEEKEEKYLPDFKVYFADGSHIWIEIKGLYNERSIRKVKAFRDRYPKEKIEVIGFDWFRLNEEEYKKIYPDWKLCIEIEYERYPVSVKKDLKKDKLLLPHSSLKEYLKNAKISIAKFSRKALIPYTTLYDVVNGLCKPREKVARRICQASDGELKMEDFGYGS